jgi:hypothetical protein
MIHGECDSGNGPNGGEWSEIIKDVVDCTVCTHEVREALVLRDGRATPNERRLEFSKPSFNGNCAVGFPPEPLANVGFPFFHVDDSDDPSVDS